MNCFIDRWATSLFFFVLQSPNISDLLTVIFTDVHHGKSMFNPFMNIYLTKTSLYVYITHFLVNFLRRALFRHNIFYDQSLFKTGVLFLTGHILNSLRINGFCDKKDISV